MTTEEQALEIAKKSIEQVFEPYKDVMRSLLGPAATEIGLALGDRLALWRSKRLLKFLKDFEQFASDNGFKVKAVPPRLLFPICENGSLEDEEDLYTRWMALLTNAARTDFDGEVLPAFPDILRQLTSEEARFLDKAHHEITKDAERRRTEVHAANPEFYGDVGTLGISGALLRSVDPILIDNLERVKLVTRTNIPLSFDDEPRHVFPHGNHLYISHLGQAFVRACTLPNKK